MFWVYEISNFEYRYYPAPLRHPHRETDIVDLRFFVFFLIYKFQKLRFCGQILFWVYEIKNFEYAYYPALIRHNGCGQMHLRMCAAHLRLGWLFGRSVTKLHTATHRAPKAIQKAIQPHSERANERASEWASERRK